MTELRDDLGLPVPLSDPPRRVVSLVPSLTEALAATDPAVLAGATDWCTRPAGLDVPRFGGTKNPAVERIAALRPELVVANEEENRIPDLDALRAAGIPVWVTRIRSLDEALTSLDRLLTAACRLPRPPWLDAARVAWSAVRPLPAARAVVPVWRRPWMVLGRDTFAGNLLARLGIANACAGHTERYPRIPLPELQALRPDLVVLPDEPYRFTAEDGPEAFPGVRAALVSGRHLTWYGPSLAEAAPLLRAQLQGPGPSGAAVE